MSIRGNTAIVGIGETPVDRLGRRPGERRRTIPEYLTWAARLAMEDAGLERKDFDGQGLAAIYTTNYLQPFWPEETASILGITPGLSLASANGGAATVSALGTGGRGHTERAGGAGAVRGRIGHVRGKPQRGRAPRRTRFRGALRPDGRQQRHRSGDAAAHA